VKGSKDQVEQDSKGQESKVNLEGNGENDLKQVMFFSLSSKTSQASCLGGLFTV